MAAQPPSVPDRSAIPAAWRIGKRHIGLDKPVIMAILNVTPDSFADAGRHLDLASAIAAAERFVREGARVLDIGAESTRPGAARVDAAEQRRRAIPVIEAIRALRSMDDVAISIDTTLVDVARAALDAGADAVNDVSAGTESDASGPGRPTMFDLVAERGAGIVLMHRLVAPPLDSYSDRYTNAPKYADVAGEVAAWLEARAASAVSRGVDRASIVLDPGLGFGKTVEQNLRLIRETSRLTSLGYPVLSGLSRKSFVGRVGLGRDSKPEERLEPTLALSVEHLRAGASLFRVHDVEAHARALLAAWTLHRCESHS